MIETPKNILVVTVGGSCEPIVNAIGTPPGYDFVYFICSKGGGKRASEFQVDGSGAPCVGSKKMPSIVEQVGLGEDRYEKVTFDVDTHVDNLAILYKDLKGVAQAIRERFPGASVIANYTGGTKSMSAALVLVAIEAGWDLQVNKGMRENVVKIETGDIPVPVATNGFYSERNRTLFQDAFINFNYSMAKMVADATLRSLRLSPTEESQWHEWRAIADGFNLWDSFFYGQALKVLKPVASRVEFYMPFLSYLTSDRKEARYYICLDLILNAERRAHQSRFDDAISRLYRALELLAQTRLMERFNLDTGHLDIKDTRIPASFREKYAQKANEKGIFHVALVEAYDLLQELDDPVGHEFDSQRSRLLDMLHKRNYSFLAHGFGPIDLGTYKRMYEVIKGFVDKCIKELELKIIWPPQLPRKL